MIAGVLKYIQLSIIDCDLSVLTLYVLLVCTVIFSIGSLNINTYILYQPPVYHEDCNAWALSQGKCLQYFGVVSTWFKNFGFTLLLVVATYWFWLVTIVLFW